MNDRPTMPADPGDDRDPVVAAALRTMVPPPHRPGFWDGLDARLSARDEPPAAPPPPPVPPPVEEPPALAEVIPLPLARRSRPRALLAAAAAALVVVVAAATLLRTANTDVETTPAAPTTEAVETSTSVDPTLDPDPDPAPSTTATGGPASVPPGTPKSTTPTTAASRGTTTTAKPASLTLSPSGLGPLQLGMTTKQATATGAVGAYVGSGNAGCGFAKPAGSYRTGDFGALFLNSRLARLYVQPGSRLRTPQGIGIGSPSSRLSAIPGTRTEGPEKYGAGTEVTIMSGGVGYQFNVENGVVREWSVGTKEGLDLTEACS